MNELSAPSSIAHDTAPALPMTAAEETAVFPNPPGFELLDSIGRGGMGVVFRARDLALNREVAVKVLQAQYSPDSAMAARFVEEAQITGQLQHPGIPAVYRVDRLADGRPFLAMKLIKGQTLQEALKEGAALDRLAIFEAIAQALAYAHAHDVLHRDLKPGNIMVGVFGEVQVMDWGLAKVLTASRERARPEFDPEATTAPTRIQSLRDADGPLTQAGSVLGTPAYMAPEQAAGEVDKVDRRSDVFGLGAILCALLTGKPPFEGKDAEAVRLNAVRGRTEAAFARLDGCGAEPAVVALAKRCLAFEPAERPADAGAVQGIVAALRREAADRARQAELDKAKAEVAAAEQAKRRRVWLGLAASLLVGLAASLGLAAWANHAKDQARQAEQTADARRIEADERRQEAETQTKLANGVKEFLQRDVLQLADPGTQQAERGQTGLAYDSEVKLRDVVLRAAKAIDGKFPDQPLVEAELRGTLGFTLLGMGRADLALPQFERVRALDTAEFGPDHSNTLRSMHNLAASYADLGRHAEALKLREETLALQKRKLGPDHPDTLSSMNNLANSYADLGRHAEARKLREETLALIKRKLGPDDPNTLASMNNLANSYANLGRHAEALKLREQTLALQKQKLGPDHPNTLASMNNLANSYTNLGRHAEALKLREQTLALQKQKLGPDHTDTLRSMIGLANCYADLGRPAEALKLSEDTLALIKRKLGPDHPDTLLSMHNLANSYVDLGRHTEALKLSEDTLALRQLKLGPDHPDTLRSMHNLATSYAALGRSAEALKLREETLALSKQKLGPDHPDTLRSMHNLATSYAALGRSAEALKLREETLALSKQKLGPEHPDTLASQTNLAISYQQLNQQAEARPLLEESFRKKRALLPANHDHLLIAASSLAGCYSALGEGARATAVADQYLETLLAKQQVHLPGMTQMLKIRNGHPRVTGDVTGCRATATFAERFRPSTPKALYDAACYRSVVARLLSDKPEEARAEADRAMAWLQKAVAAGFKDRAHMEKDSDLDAVRGREDFQKLLDTLPKPLPKK